MKLKVLAISDTHLGEETSLLSFPQGLQQLWYALREKFGSGEKKFDAEGKFEVEELVLLGDIPDTALASTSQATTHTNAFIQTLRSAANIEKIIYIPGNHDHTLWTNYRERRYGPNSHYITKQEGEVVVDHGKQKREEGDGPWDVELLSMFFGYPYGSIWNQIKEEMNLDFVVANPLYAKKIKDKNQEDRTYVFAHGTHFRWDVTSPQSVKKFFDISQLDQLFGKIEIESKCDVTQARDLNDLEKIISPFVDSLWQSSRNNPTTKSDQFWYLCNVLRAKLSGKSLEDHKKRNVDAGNRLLSLGDMPTAIGKSWIWQITDEDVSIKRWYTHFLPHMKNAGLPTKNLTFVYGDTHHGGWGKLSQKEDSSDSIRVYNCGGWVMHQDKDYHPACHLFAVAEGGEEYMLDVSYLLTKVGEDSLRELAAVDAENKYQNSSRILKAILHLI